MRLADDLLLKGEIEGLKLDGLLTKKEEIGSFVLARLREKSADSGVEFLFAGLKDVILPGEFREILNTVLIAERKAQANVITRREEVASTRSLLNKRAMRALTACTAPWRRRGRTRAPLALLNGIMGLAPDDERIPRRVMPGGNT